ncbi:Protein FAM117A like [Actinidia chinensis var. chinensis]|uniref:Protein FAM117A like n=1 Tax=Actinidia chinensis var. chinensis TaxID=1590841 RepID=A0A2R6RF30_ACTCC|nr:Protein FAM117A like [Actinidia chinensis var. chinensis]
MSFSQQPDLVYPNTVTNQPPSHSSNGSFGTVFIVLAVIVALAALACCFRWLCDRGQHHHHPAEAKHGQAQPRNPHFLGREGSGPGGNGEIRGAPRFADQGNVTTTRGIFSV